MVLGTCDAFLCACFPLISVGIPIEALAYSMITRDDHLQNVQILEVPHGDENRR